MGRARRCGSQDSALTEIEQEETFALLPDDRNRIAVGHLHELELLALRGPVRIDAEVDPLTPMSINRDAHRLGGSEIGQPAKLGHQLVDGPPDARFRLAREAGGSLR